MTLDARTIALMIVVLTFISAAMLALVHRQARGMQGIGWWAIAEAMIGLGLLANLFQALLSPWIAFVLGNTLLVAGLGLAVYGIKLYLLRPPPRLLIFGVIGATVVVTWWFGIVYPIPAVRIVWLSLTYALFSWFAAVALLIPVPQPLRTAYWITGGAYAAYGTVMLLRAVVVGLFDQGMPVFAPSFVNLLTFVVAAIAQLITTFGLVLMVTYRMSMNMERLASLDALTGALNRRSFEQRASHLAAEGSEAGRPIGVIMLDIDHFKQVNDRYGHPAGDFVLQEVTTLARAQLRERDLFARMGGEEFCVVLAEGDEDRAARIAERIRETCAHAPMRFNGVDIEVRLSAGVAAGRVQGGVIEALIGEADLALYEAKQTGRDKVVRWSTIAANSKPAPAQRVITPMELSRLF